MKVVTTERVPIKIWSSEIEEGALSQAQNVANLPFIHRHFSLMPDCHMGYGVPIGGVLATKDYKKICKALGYSESQIKEYGILIKAAVKVAK